MNFFLVSNLGRIKDYSFEDLGTSTWGVDVEYFYDDY